MKKSILKLANSILKSFGAEIVKNISNDILMSSAMQRIVLQGFEIKNIIDIGASNGKWSVSAMNFFPDAYFTAIEPLTERKSSLEKLKREHVNFDFELCVAGESNAGQITLNVSEDMDGSTVDGIGGEPRQVPIKTIDLIASEKNLQGPFLLKFDTHGYEIPILHGAKETLKQTNIIIMEVYNFKITHHAKRFHEICFYMEELGFRCYDIAEPILRLYDKTFWQMDMLFCKSDSKIFSYSQYK